MLVSLTHRFAFLAMSKCASTAVHQALATRVEVAISQPSGAKHTNYRRFDGQLRRYLENYSDGRIETVCLFREPVDWLASWWRYRARRDIPHPENSTAEMDFETFVTCYLDNHPLVRIGRPAVFVTDRAGAVGVDHIFRYENLDGCLAWIAARTGYRIALSHLNVSPPAHRPADLSPGLRARLEREMARDFEIYRGLAR